MFGFRFDTREEVDVFHARALALGGADEGTLPWRARMSNRGVHW
jgi:hypothetical protein